MVAEVTIGSFDWSRNGILHGLKELQENATFADLSFTCSDGLVLDAHQAVIERHSTLLKEFSRSAQCCLCRGKDCEFRLGQVSVVLPDVSSDTMETLLQLLYVGEANVDGEDASAQLLDACRMLRVTLPSDMTKKLREAQKENAQTSSPESSPAPKIRLKSAAELLGPTAATSESGVQDLPSDSDAVDVTIEVNPFPGTPVTLEPRSDQNDEGDRDDEPMLLDETPPLPGIIRLPAPPTPSTAEAILRVANIPTVNPNIGIQLPTTPCSPSSLNLWQPHADMVNGPFFNNANNVKKKTGPKKGGPPKEKTKFGGSEGLPEDQCPVCHKFYPNHKKREHFATTHFQTELRKYVTFLDGASTCTLCGKRAASEGSIARHVGLLHNKLAEVVGPEHYHYIEKLGKWGKRDS